ncbi:MAG: DNA polymerase III subunit beta [Clostridiales bacterium]|nr:DNA polymerase III subunit beta [Clostridiales bacterium]
MKFSCERAVLAEAVATAGHAVLPRSSNPVLEGLLLSLRGDQLSLTGYDGETGIRCLLSVAGLSDGDILLPCSTLGDILRKLPEGTVRIEVAEERVRISSGEAEFVILGLSAEGFPQVDFSRSGLQVELQQKLLRSLILQTVFAVSQSDSKPVHTGCLFHLESGQIEVVGVDGYRLALRREKLEGSEAEARFVVPGRTLQDISRILGESELPVSVFVGERSVLFETENISVVTRTIEGEFLNYRSSIPADGPISCRVEVKGFLDCLERASLLISERQRSPVRIVFRDREAAFSCSTPLGRVTDKLPISCEGGTVEIGFNNRFLQEAFKNCGQSEVKLELANNLSPMVIRPVEGEAFTYLVLPVRLKSE